VYCEKPILENCELLITNYQWDAAVEDPLIIPVITNARQRPYQGSKARHHSRRKASSGYLLRNRAVTGCGPLFGSFLGKQKGTEKKQKRTEIR